MFIELVDALRCIEPHEDSWLVLSTRRMDGRSVVDGTLGCPVCRRSYAIADGVAYIGVAPGGGPASSLAAPTVPPTEDEAVRLAALLDLTTPGGIVVLAGAWAPYAAALASLAPVRLLLLDPISRRDDEAALSFSSAESVSVVRAAADTIPIAAGAARGVAFDAVSAASGPRLAAAVRVAAAHGRVVAPAAAPVPAGLRELARDDELWVAARDAAASAPIALRRPRRA